MKRANLLAGIAILVTFLLLVPMAVLATEYAAGTNGTLYMQARFANGTVDNYATVTANLRASNGTLILDGVSMSYISGSDGYYKYDFTVPSEEGAYTAEYETTHSDSRVSYSGETINVVEFFGGSANITPSDIEDIAEASRDATLGGGISDLTDRNTLGGSLNFAIGGDRMLLLIVAGMVVFLTVYARKTREMLWCILASAGWWGLTVWLFFSGAGFFNLTDDYARIICIITAALSFPPLIWSMNTEIRHEAKGQSWVSQGSPPRTKTLTPAEEYRRKLHRRLYGR